MQVHEPRSRLQTPLHCWPCLCHWQCISTFVPWTVTFTLYVVLCASENIFRQVILCQSHTCPVRKVVSSSFYRLKVILDLLASELKSRLLYANETLSGISRWVFVFCFFTYVHFWLVSTLLIQCLENKLFLISTVQSILKKSTLNIHWKDWCWSWSSNNLATWYEEPTHWKDLDARKNWRQEEKGTTEDEMFVWYHQLNGHEFEQALGDSGGQRSLGCCSPWGLPYNNPMR